MRLLSYLAFKAPLYLVYMAQQVEYEPGKLIAWLKRLPDLQTVMHRKSLVLTKKAVALASFQYVLIVLYLILIGAICLRISFIFLFLALLVPVISIISLILAIYGGRITSIPFNAVKIRKSRKILAGHKGLKIAILGSYGKTTMKELMRTILSESKKVKATPGNKNVPISHARWAVRLKGDEDVLLIEFGESKPGDIATFCQNTLPNMGVITGIASNHLDKYKTIDAVADDLFSINKFVNQKNVYANMDTYLTKRYKSSGVNTNVYSEEGTAKVKIGYAKISINGMSFAASIGKKEKVEFKTKLIGRHLLGPLAVCIEIADSLGLSIEQIRAGVSKTKPFEHRLQPRELGGAWIIDDTYNGSLEGFMAGLKLLSELKAKRKIYVTPGLVDQGEETERVHSEISRAIAKTSPDKVVLMKNSTTDYIKNSLTAAGYKSELQICDNPLEFYTNIEHYIAAGDIWLLQNDWPDAYI